MPLPTDQIISGYCAFLVEMEADLSTPVDVFSIALTPDMKVHMHSAAGPITPEYLATIIDVMENSLQVMARAPYKTDSFS
ncbi:hypothetical protein [Dyadobacter aurulentus]|uniref:hypothetical protein n=1 Tax=Dyadobacter sp. UC 10 TaxID=2605428 RepID=UPI0011F22A9E|nr:hypothetical protein [Dyadobacter sp. UC 10]KAA0992756.1 hypothetical protein FXO21_22555 [Dyadobacter sp. UC 10]